jgi:hypothetical protein
MRERPTRIVGLVVSAAYVAFIAWMAAQQPQTLADVTGGLTAAVGAYRVDAVAFADGLRFFRQDQFVEARAAFGRADPAARDPITQFYVAYSYYRQGWGLVAHDDLLYAEGLAAIDRAIAIAPAGRIVVDDASLEMRTADEVRAELVAGMTLDTADLNPMRVLRRRK